MRNIVRQVLIQHLDADVAEPDAVAFAPERHVADIGVDLKCYAAAPWHPFRRRFGVLEIGDQTSVEVDSDEGRFAFHSNLYLVPLVFAKRSAAPRVGEDHALGPGKVDGPDVPLWTMVECYLMAPAVLADAEKDTAVDGIIELGIQSQDEVAELAVGDKKSALAWGVLEARDQRRRSPPNGRPTCPFGRPRCFRQPLRVCPSKRLSKPDSITWPRVVCSPAVPHEIPTTIRTKVLNNN